MHFKQTDNKITVLGETDFRGQRRRFGIKRVDRRSHLYFIGKTGTGKSTLIANLAHQDALHGEGFALLDPHGDLVEHVLEVVPEQRRGDLIYFNVPDHTRPLGFNPLEQVPPLKRALAASGVLEVFKKLWADSWGPRLEHILRNALLSLFDWPGSTLADILRMLDDAAFRHEVVTKVQSPQVRDFWLRQYEKYPAYFRAEAVAPIQNKVGAFLASPVLYGILTQPKSAFEIRQVMDEGKILLVNLAKGKIGEDTAMLLGSLLVSRIGLAGLSRADVPEEERRDFYLYLDEFHAFTTLSLSSMLSELRKYRVNLTLAHQYLEQLDPKVREAILSNTGTMIVFRLGLNDALLLEKEFYPEFTASNLVSLPNHHMYMRLMIDGGVSKPFSAVTLPRAWVPNNVQPQKRKSQA